MDIPEGTVLADAKRNGWDVVIRCNHSVSIARCHTDRAQGPNQLGLSRYAAEAAEQAAQHPDMLGIARRVKDVAGVHKILWPDQTETKPILNLAILSGQIQLRRIASDDGSDKAQH